MMNKYCNLNVLNQRKDYMSDDAITQVANMINALGANRAQRKKLARDLGKVENIMSHTQNRVNKKAFTQYQEACNENMRTFFAILGIVMAKNYGWKNEEGNEQIEELFDILNAYLVEYQGTSVDNICKICEEVTGIQLVSE